MAREQEVVEKSGEYCRGSQRKGISGMEVSGRTVVTAVIGKPSMHTLIRRYGEQSEDQQDQKQLPILREIKSLVSILLKLQQMA